MFNFNQTCISIFKILLITSICTSCASTSTPTTSPKTSPKASPETSLDSSSTEAPTSNLSSDSLADKLKAKYADQSTYHLDNTVYTLDRNETLIMDLDFPMSSDHNPYDMFQFFLDADLTIPVWRPGTATYYKGDTRIKIKPRNYPLFRTEFQEESVRENANWGNAGTLYLAKYYDSKGNMTKEPQEVSIVKIKTELPRPNVTLTTDNQGFATLTWAPVDGATNYSIYKLCIEDGHITDDEILLFCGETTEPYYNDFSIFTHDSSHITGRQTNNILCINVDFAYDESSYSYGYVVIAEGPNGSSEMSRLITPNDYAAILPYGEDYNANPEELAQDNELQLPFYMPIEMCNGSSVLYPIVYDPSTIQEYTDEYAVNESATDKGTAQCMTIIGRPQGTPFEEVFYFYYYPEKETIDSVFNRFLEKQKQFSTNASGLNSTPCIEESNETSSDASNDANTDNSSSDTDTSPINTNNSIPITATNALSEYLTYHLLNGETTIPIKDFAEASDLTYLSDALFESIYQNSLILGADDISITKDATTLHVDYTLEKSVQKERQKMVLDEAQRIVDAIITPDMSDLEKEEALNNYLCENLSYDDAALESAEKNNYAYADPKFDDSFTVYGALINKVCVCKGYAEAFKLLADLSGLDALVVTGNLNSVGHAWNKVNIEGEWLTIDVTNNDSEMTPNALFNLPASAADLMLVEDKAYILDSNYSTYHGSENAEFEYYHLNNNYFEQDELKQVLIDKFSKPYDTLILRTDFDITDEAVYDLFTDVVSYVPDASFSYFNWYGILCIRKE